METRIKLIVFFFCFSLISFADAAQRQRSGYRVAQDGSGDFTTIQDAINAVPDNSSKRIKIAVKAGVYKEKLVIPAAKKHISLIGESALQTIISYGDYSGKDGINTFNSHTVLVLADGFQAENITFENTAGPVGQAVALHVEGDQCVFINCRILGNQDTLLTAGDNSNQYYRNCYIEGTTDFIFGSATAVFEKCTIFSKKNSYITAASTPQGHKYGYVFLGCTLDADAAFKKVYLGRPWRPYANVVFIDTKMGDHILPDGWHAWNNTENHKTTFYAEYGSTGPGFIAGARVPWSKQLTAEEAKRYTIKQIFNGNSQWIPLK